MRIDVSVAIVYSGVHFDYFVFFETFFSVFPFVCKKKIILYFFVLVLIKYVSKNKFIYFWMSTLSTV